MRTKWSRFVGSSRRASRRRASRNRWRSLHVKDEPREPRVKEVRRYGGFGVRPSGGAGPSGAGPSTGQPFINLTDDNDSEDSDFYAGDDWKGLAAECTDCEYLNRL